MTSPLRIVVTGLIAQYPVGGIAWHYGQYAAGFAGLGHDVYYLEDTGWWPYNPREGGISKTCDFNVEYLAAVMARFGLEDRWAYRFPQGDQWFGLPPARRDEVLRSADVLVNVSGSIEDPGRYRHIPRLVYIDSDPVFTQVKLAGDQAYFTRVVNLHDVHFSFGQRLADPVPETGHEWRPTRQPILPSEWRPGQPAREVFTSVMNWTSYKPVVYNGRSYGQKNEEFMRFLDLPKAVAPRVLEIALNVGKVEHPPRDLLVERGWRLADPAVVCPDAESYRAYIESSRAEWSVAKHGYVAGRSGWFSDRSACYLAAGRPVVVQDTGFSDVLPVGEGIVAFTTPEEAAEGIRSVDRDYARHSRAARELALEFFAAGKVLPRLLEDAFAAPVP